MTAITNKEIEKLIEKELKSCIENYGLFNSLHEAYAVTLEEVQECEEEINRINECIDVMWFQIKHNLEAYKIRDNIDYYSKTLKNMIVEAIQICAVMEKTKMLIDEMEDKENGKNHKRKD